MFDLYTFIRCVAKPIIKVIFPKQIVEGIENIPEDKGFILCCNHTHFMDVAFLIVNIKRKINFMAKKELFKNKIIADFFTAMGAFLVDRGSGKGVPAIKVAEDIVKKGEIIASRLPEEYNAFVESIIEEKR